MPAPRGPRLPDDLRNMLGNREYKHALDDLSAGYVMERQLHRGGEVMARWSSDPSSDHMLMQDDGVEALLECSCQAFQLGDDCRHIAGLIAAWALYPETFVPSNRDYNIDNFYSEFVLDDDDDMDDEFLEDGEALPETPSPFDIPAERRQSPTVRTMLPDLIEDYRQTLAGATVAEMRQIARRRGIALTGARDKIAETLATSLGSSEAVHAATAGLSPDAHLILAILPFAVRGARADAAALQSLLTALGISLKTSLEKALDELGDAGLVRQGPQGSLAWPSTLMLYGGAEPQLAPLLPPSTQVRSVAAAPLDFVSLVTRLLFVLRARPWAARPPPAPVPFALGPYLNGWPVVPSEVAELARQAGSSRGMRGAVLTVPPADPLLTDEAHAQLSSQLETPPARLDFALAMMISLGLLHRAPDDTVVVDENTLLKFISLHPAQVIMPMYQAWMQTRHWIEFDLAVQRTPGLRLRRDLQMAYSQPPSILSALSLNIRGAVHNCLLRLPAGEWIDLAAFVAQAHALNNFGVVWRLPEGLALEVNGRSLMTQTLSDWTKSFQPWLEALLTGPLHWQGVVDLGYDRDKLVAFRLTDLGALLTVKTFSFTAPELESAAGQPLLFEPDGTLRLNSAVADPAILGLLATLGDLRPGPGGSLATQPTAQGALRVFQSGWDAERLIAALEQAAGQPVPPALAGQWREWSRRLGELQIYPDLALLELGDDFAFDELMANTSLSRSLLYRFGPRLAAIRSEAVEALRAELVDKGYTPKVAGAA